MSAAEVLKRNRRLLDSIPKATTEEDRKVSAVLSRNRDLLKDDAEAKKRVELLELLPQGHGSGLDADTVDGLHAAEILARAPGGKGGRSGGGGGGGAGAGMVMHGNEWHTEEFTSDAFSKMELSEYDNDGNLKESKFYDKQGVLKYVNQYSYDDGKLVEWRRYDALMVLLYIL